MPQTCSKCNSPIPDDAAHCPSCGEMAPTALGAESQTEPFLPSASDSSPEAIQARLTRALGPNYEVKRLVGRGGFALVFELWDRNLERRLAAKVLIPEVAWTPGTLERFKQEARTVARLNHPNILPIHFVGDGEDLAFYVMPFVEGQSLKDRLAQGRPPLEEVLEIGTQVLDALGHAHEDDMVHRDIKPDNVMIDARTGRALLVDFGIAKALDPRRQSNMTQAGFAVGTPHYMSPEQTLGDPIDARSDLYSFGVMLFEMATGQKPFTGDTSQEIVAHHIADAPPDPREIEPDVPDWLGVVILRCLEKKADARFQNASEIVNALKEQHSAAAPGPDFDVLGGDIVQGSDFDNDDLFVFQGNESAVEEIAPPPPEPETPVVPQEPAPAPPVPREPAESPQAEAASLELESVEPQRADPDPAAESSDQPQAGSNEPEETPVQDESQTEVRHVGTMAGDRAKQEEEEKETRKSGYGVFVGSLVGLLVVVVALGAPFAGYGPEGWQNFVRGLLRPIGVEAGAPSAENQILITNSLVAAVDLLIDGEIDRRIAPGERAELPLSGHVGSSLAWTLIRPVSDGGEAMGTPVRVELAARAESQSSRQYVISASMSGRRLVAPVINNFSNRDIVVQVVNGNSGSPCNCRIPAGTRRAQIGYYPLEESTSIRAYDAASPYRGTFQEARDVFPGVDALSGEVEVTFRGAQ